MGCDRFAELAAMLSELCDGCDGDACRPILALAHRLVWSKDSRISTETGVADYKRWCCDDD